MKRKRKKFLIAEELLQGAANPDNNNHWINNWQVINQVMSVICYLSQTRSRHFKPHDEAFALAKTVTPCTFRIEIMS